MSLRLKRPGRFARETDSNLMVEFAMLGPLFLVFLLIVFEVSYDLFLQSELDTTLQAVAREVQIGTATPGSNAPAFVAANFCPLTNGLMNCNNLYVREQEFMFDKTACPDLYSATMGSPPITNGILQLGYYGGAGLNVGPTSCQATNNTAGTPGTVTGAPWTVAITPNGQTAYVTQQGGTTITPIAIATNTAGELIILSAVYVAPSFLGGLVGATVNYRGGYIRAIYSSSTFETEYYTATTVPNPC